MVAVINLHLIKTLLWLKRVFIALENVEKHNADQQNKLANDLDNTDFLLPEELGKLEEAILESALHVKDTWAHREYVNALRDIENLGGEAIVSTSAASVELLTSPIST